jgi:hypothetical protein
MTPPSERQAEVPKYLVDRERAQRRDTLLRAGAVAAVVLCLAGAAALHGPILRQRARLQLVGNVDVKNVPPRYAWVTAMAGPFRGLAIDMLWIRAENLKNAGKYYESNQLAEWICTLQPRFAAVWAYHAWNLSYNISVGTHTPEERWQWVYNGIRLLRDRGIPNNPQVLALYKELSWILFHKVGDMADDMHWYYKREFATLMENLLGPPPLAADAEAMVAWFRPVAEAPTRLEDLLAEYPSLKSGIAALAAVGVDVEATTDPWQYRHPLEGTFFDRYGRLIAGTEFEMAAYRAKPPARSDADRRFVEAFRSIPPEAGTALVNYLRSKVLREKYHMDPAFMLSLMTNMIPGRPGQIVPLDWRMAEAHSIYWSRYGVKATENVRSIKEHENEVLNTDRETLYCLMRLCSQGRLIFEINREHPNLSTVDLAPDLRMVEPMHQMFLAMGRKHAEKGENVGQTAGEMLRSGHVNTLEAAIVYLFARGELARANRYLTYLRENYMGPDGKVQPRYQMDVEEFVIGEIGELKDTYKHALALIHEFLRGALLSLAQGNGEAHLQQVQTARMVWNQYMKESGDTREGRLSLPPFDEMRADALREFLAVTRAMLLLVRVWQAEEPQIKQIVYNDPELLDLLRSKCDTLGYDFAKAFPEPPGMEAYRKAHPRRPRPEEEYERRYETEAPTQ